MQHLLEKNILAFAEVGQTYKTSYTHTPNLFHMSFK